MEWRPASRTLTVGWSGSSRWDPAGAAGLAAASAGGEWRGDDSCRGEAGPWRGSVRRGPSSTPRDITIPKLQYSAGRFHVQGERFPRGARPLSLSEAEAGPWCQSLVPRHAGLITSVASLPVSPRPRCRGAGRACPFRKRGETGVEPRASRPGEYLGASSSHNQEPGTRQGRACSGREGRGEGTR